MGTPLTVEIKLFSAHAA
jgi:hypothetical protein